MPDAAARPSEPVPPDSVDPAAGAPSGLPSGFQVTAPAIAIPRGGGAVRGIGEKFAVDAVTGTGSVTVPLAASPGRSGSGPQPVLRYDSGTGNGPWGLGWRLDISSVRRTTDRGRPRFADDAESDTFLLRGSEDLVPCLDGQGRRLPPEPTRLGGADYAVHRYLPRVEGSFLLIERWVQVGRPAEVSWRTVSSDNVTTWYGRSAESRIFDPADPARVFEWLICATYDDRGNVTSYRYAEENGDRVPAEVWEANRSAAARTANRYLKRVQYGNRTPYSPAMDADAAEPPLPGDWLFELVLDYGDHSGAYPSATPDQPWPARADATSDYRPGFEVRTSRRCERALMFHHIAEDPAVGPELLVRSTEFGYGEVPADQRDPAAAGYSLLATITHRSFQRDEAGAYHDRALPPVSLRYSATRIADVVSVPAADLPNLPAGIAGDRYRWVDLDGDGMPGVLAEVDGAWHYQPNRGDATFGPIQTLPARPALAMLAPARQQFVDLAAEGRADLVDFGASPPGYHGRDGDGWSGFVPFTALPTIDWAAGNLRFADLTGAGRADALVAEDDLVTWYASQGRDGFAGPAWHRQPGDERDGPRVAFDDGTGTMFLADMCGDGPADIVRVRNGDVCYWPNLGYGRFGRRVTLGNAPRFDTDDAFDPARIRLADVDGSGPADLLYLGRDGVQIYFNRGGNLLTDARVIDAPLATGDIAAVTVVDLLGDGTACLVWNSALPADSGHPMRYLPLLVPATAGNATRKPYLLTEVDNNMGAVTEVEYTPSTRFMLDDARLGRPWVSRLPFPVQCVSRVSIRDRWRRATVTSRYTYHHGCFAGAEREFRGFGRIEQTDTEDYASFAADHAASPFVTADRTLHQPPVRTVTWYDTGEPGNSTTGEFFAARYRLTGPFRELPPPAPELPDRLGAREWREARRACRGTMLRQEAYELGPGGTPARLYTVTQHRRRVRQLQPAGPNRYGVYLPVDAESVEYQHDLALPAPGAEVAPDPRITHTLNLRYDEYGKLEQSVTAAYGRRSPAPPPDLPAGAVPGALITAVQAAAHLSYAETRRTGDVLVRGPGPRAPVRHRRLRMTYEESTYELTGIAPPGGAYLDRTTLLRYELSADGRYPPDVPDGEPPVPVGTLPYHRLTGPAGPQRRIVRQTRTRYFDDDTGATPAQPLPFGTHGPRGLAYENYLLALTADLLDAVLVQRDGARVPGGNLLDWPAGAGHTARDLVTSPATGGYLDGASWGAAWAGQWWLRSGRSSYGADARASFFLPHAFTDAFGATTQVRYDDLFLHIRDRTDPAGNSVTVAAFDYRVLAPRAVTDASGNREEAVFDILGLVVATGRLGKRVNGRWQGDDLAGFDIDRANPPAAQVQAFCTSNRLDAARARQWLGGAGARFVYYFGDAQTMPGVCVVTREQYVGTLAAGQVSPLQVTLDGADGLGRVLLHKAQAEPGPGDPGAVSRWIISGRVVANNKGNPVLRYQPEFSADFGFELPPAVSPVEISHYDGPGRLVRTEYPDGSYARTEYSAWHVAAHDRDDTVLDSPWYAARRRYDPAGPLPSDPGGVVLAAPDERAAWLTARHAGTPATEILDSLGREVIAVAHNRVEDPAGPLTFDGRTWRDDMHVTVTKLDAEGKPLWVRDANGNLATQHVTPPRPAGAAGDGLEALPAGAATGYDLAGTLLFQSSMDAGPRWMLHDGAGRPLLQWDVNDRLTDVGAVVTERRLLTTRYDTLHRMVEQRLGVNGAEPALIEIVVYRDTAGRTPAQHDDDRRLNLVGRAVEHWDAAGRWTARRADLAGSVEHATWTLTRDPAAPVVDYAGDRAAVLTAEEFHQVTRRDALGRTTALLDWHGGPGTRVAVYEPRYNQRGALAAEDLTIGATATAAGWNGGTRTTAIRELRYDANGQRVSLELGNGTLTRYEYDPATQRLVHLFTSRRPAVPGDCAGDPAAARPARPCGVQNLHYTYDPMGHVTRVQNDAQDTIWFANQQVEPSNDFGYDALYRLTETAGREGAAPAVPVTDREAGWPTGAFPAPDVLRRYRQRYTYDRAGNLTAVRHVAGVGSWTRQYAYAYQLVGQPPGNRLARTWSGTASWAATAPGRRVVHRHDPHGNLGNLTRRPPRADLRWDWRDLLRAFALPDGGTAFYTYDAGRQRVRKRIVRSGGVVEERIYLGGFERYRRSVNGAVTEEVESHHLRDGASRVLLVDDIRRARPASGRAPGTVFRYQYADLLGSAGTELDAEARLISYEEFHPYGSSAYRRASSAAEVPARRYRYTGAERDEESGLSYHGARYLSTALGRWVSADPAGTEGGLNLYAYAAGNPVSKTDPSGRQPVDVPEQEVRGQARMTMEQAAAAIRDTWSWEDQDFAQQARNFYYQQFRGAYREKSNEGMKIAFTVWAAMGIFIVGGVAGGLVEGAIITAAGGPEAAGLGLRILASGIGGSVGASAEATLEQGLRATVGERQLTPGEVGLRVGLGGAAGAVVRAAGELIAAGVKAVREVASLGDELGEAAAEGLTEGAAEVVHGIPSSTAGGGGIPRLTDKQLIARAEALYLATVKIEADAEGRVLTQAAVGRGRWSTTAVLQGVTKDGRVVTLAAINSSDRLAIFRTVVGGTGDELVEPSVFFTLGPRGGFHIGHEHAEAVLYEAASEMGLESMRVASSIPGCEACQQLALKYGVQHVNPKPLKVK